MKRRRQYNDAIAALTNQSGNPPDETAVAERLGVSVEKLRGEYATAEPLRFETIDEVYSDEAPWFASDEPDAFAQLADADLRDALASAIAGLPEREARSEEHTSELQSLMRNSYAVFCLK